MTTLKRFLVLLCPLLGLLSLPATGFADDARIDLSEGVNNGIFNLPFGVTAGTLLLCDSGSVPGMVNGSWFCLTNGMAVAPSDSVTFTASGKNGVFCSDPGDFGDFCDPSRKGDFAIQEAGVENGVEKTLYDPAAGQPGFNLNDKGHYNLYSDTPEPASLLMLGSGLVGLAGFARRRLFRG